MDKQDAAAPSKDVCRIGLISRVDYPSNGFRKALLELAAEEFKREDVHFIILAGGLVYEKAVKDKQRRVKRDQRVVATLIKGLESKASTPKRAQKLQELYDRRTALKEEEDEHTAEKMASELAKLLPRFTNKAGERLKIYIVPSKVYDGQIGEEAIRLLSHKREKDVRVYRTGGDKIPVKQANKVLQVLVPIRRPWHGDFFSTGVERQIKDHIKQTSRALPDVFIVGCMGASITKPQGESPRPYVAVPVLHNLSDTTVSENQVAVRVAEIRRDSRDPVVRTYSYKDHMSLERTYVGSPAKPSALQRQLVELIKIEGRVSPGILAGLANADRTKVEHELHALVRSPGEPPLKTWPGLEYDGESRRFDFSLPWLQRYLRYPSTSGKRLAEDGMVVYGCLHAGSFGTDYRYFIEAVPEVVLKTGARILAGCGDFTEGLKHNLALRGEVVGGINCTDQEILAGNMLAKVNIEVFKVRFEQGYIDLLASLKGAAPSKAQLESLVLDALLVNPLIPGNHDLWACDLGYSPMQVMIMTMVRRITDAVEAVLASKKLCLQGLSALVERNVTILPGGRMELPSGLKMSMLHPHMARAKTTSIRPQEMLDKEFESQVVLGANFHVGEHLEVWGGDLGQRVCLQVGTLKHSSDFENNKLKIVDQGFAYLKVLSEDQRVVRTEGTFYSNESSKAKLIKRGQIFDDLLKSLNLDSF